ncbi:MAG: YtxH domain-containing protein [Rhodothermales bacterium]|nr:YtxH domain-containing protein [Rhodothermales bacterium]
MKSESLTGIARAAAWGVVVGGGVGFALGMLLAPEEGRKLRRRLAFQLEHISGNIGDYLDGMSSTAVSSAAREKGEAVIADVEERAEAIRQEIDDILESFPTRQQSTSNN